MTRYRIDTMGRTHEAEGESAEQAIIALMETQYADYGRKWSIKTNPDDPPGYYDIQQQRRYVTYAQVRALGSPGK